VVAEGVETSYQHEFLSAHGCDQLQGYRFSRPVPADEITTFFGPSQVLDHWPTGTAHHPAPTRRSAG
jgi:EAL domain-containing protein (putative c-di-GMP-specific phosphodiesterase class I)